MYLLLIRLRLHWYALSTGRVVMRHWQAFVIAGLFVPMGTPMLALLRALAFPLTAIFAPSRSLLWHLSYVGLIQAVTLAWVMLQRSPIGGNDFMRYAATLPISKSLGRRVDLTMLFLANSILLIPVVTAVIFSSPLVSSMGSIFQVSALFVLLSLVLVMQLAALEKNAVALPGILLADLLLSASLTLPVSVVSWLLLALALASAVSLPFLRWPSKISLDSILHPSTAQPLSMRPRFGWLSPALRIQVKALLVKHPVSSALRMSVVLVLAVGADLLIRIFQFDARTLPTAIIAMAAIALILSGIYRTLQSTHAPMRSYLAALPLGRRYWGIRDTLFVILLGAVPLGILLLPLLVYRVSTILTLVALALAYQGLLALLRLPLLFGGRQAVLLGVILAGTWSGAAIAAIL